MVSLELIRNLEEKVTPAIWNMPRAPSCSSWQAIRNFS
jgi:hypothetical protein